MCACMHVCMCACVYVCVSHAMYSVSAGGFQQRKRRKWYRFLTRGCTWWVSEWVSVCLPCIITLICDARIGWNSGIRTRRSFSRKKFCLEWRQCARIRCCVLCVWITRNCVVPFLHLAGEWISELVTQYENVFSLSGCIYVCVCMCVCVCVCVFVYQ